MSLKKQIESLVDNNAVTILFCLAIISLLFSIWALNVTLVLNYAFFLVIILSFSIKYKTKPIDFFFLLFFFFNLISLSWTNDLNYGVKVVLKRVFFLSLPIIFIVIRSKKLTLNIDSIIKAFILSVLSFGVVLLLLSLSNVLINNKPLVEIFTKNVRLKLADISPISFHPPYYGVFINFTIVLLFFLRDIGVISLFKFSSAFFFCLVLLYINSSLMSYAGLTSSIMIILVYKSNKKTILLVSSIFLILTAFIFLSYRIEVKEALHFDPRIDYWETPKYRVLRFLKEGDPSRKETWQLSWDIIKQNPWFGSGVGDFVNSIQDLRNTESYAYMRKLNSHNQYLGILGQVGVLGLVPLLIIFFLALKKAFRNKSYVFYCFISIILLSLSSENFIDRQWGAFFFCFFYYLLYEYTENFTKKVSKSRGHN